jgi:hypothetical protein
VALRDRCDRLFESRGDVVFDPLVLLHQVLLGLFDLGDTRCNFGDACVKDAECLLNGFESLRDHGVEAHDDVPVSVWVVVKEAAVADRDAARLAPQFAALPGMVGALLYLAARVLSLAVVFCLAADTRLRESTCRSVHVQKTMYKREGSR